MTRTKNYRDFEDTWLAVPPKTKFNRLCDAAFAVAGICLVVMLWTDAFSVCVGAFLFGAAFGKWSETSVHIPISESALRDAMVQDLVAEVNARVEQ